MQGHSSGIPLEIVAAITAALSAVLDQPVGNFVVTSITAEQPAAPAAYAQASGWAKAGVLESQLMRRQFGLRIR